METKKTTMSLSSARRFFGKSPAAAAAVFILCCCCVDACETVLTHAEIAADRARAVEFYGPTVDTRFGATVSAAGDFDGDGFDDFAIVAPQENSGNGAVYVVFGRSSAAWTSATLDFNATETPDAASWIRISGVDNIRLGSLGIAKGDFNGDGRSDLLLGATYAAKAFVLFGRAGTLRSFNVSELESGTVPGFVITGGIGTLRYVGNAGDMNGDGIEDLLVTAHTTVATSVNVIFGVLGETRSAFNLSTIDGTNGFSLADGSSYLGYNMAGSAGDVNGDGMQDLVLGSNNFNGNFGRAYVVFARNTSDAGQQWSSLVNLTSDLDGSNGFIVDGPFSTATLGWSVAGAGDVNADGFADVFIGSYNSYSGAWIVLGHPAPWTSPLNASQLDGTNGFHFKSTNEAWGWSGGSAGDVNSDGFDDIVIGGHNALGSTGAVVVLFGRAGSWPAEIGQSDAVGSMGFFVEGPSALSQFGEAASGAGDVNGDGIADFIVGAYNHNFSQGYAALVFGTPDDHCAVCSNTTAACIACADGFFLNSVSVCINTSTATSSSSPYSSAFSSSAAPAVLSSSPSSSSSSSVHQQGVSVVVIINFLEDVTDPTELQEEIASVLGIDAGLVSVVVISPTEVEVTIIGSEETAQRLVDIINNGGAGSDDSGLGLLRKAINAHIRKDTDGSSDDGVDAAPRVAFCHAMALLISTSIVATIGASF